MRLAHKIGLIAVAPLLAFALQSGRQLTAALEHRRAAQVAQANLPLAQATAKLVLDLQAERDNSVLFSEGKVTWDRVRDWQNRADLQQQAFLKALPSGSASDEAKEKAQDALSDLDALRREALAARGPAGVQKGYAALLQPLLELQAALAPRAPENAPGGGTELALALLNLALLLGLGTLSFVLARSLMRTTAATARAMETIARGEGDLTQRLPCTTEDELGDLARAFNAYLDKLQGMVGQVQSHTHTLARNATEFSSISGQMATGAMESSDRARMVAAAAEELVVSAASMASGMEEASTSMSTVAESTQQMTDTIGDLAATSEKARGITDDAAKRTQDISRMMQELGHAAQEIGKVTETITIISSQTNLLALNATIEAARAGSAGKGFAVVANEIKELARQTAQATEDIKSRISAIQASSGAAIAANQEIAQVIKEVNDLVASISTAIEEESMVTQDIAHSINQATLGAQDTYIRMVESTQVTQELAKDILGVHEAADHIAAGSAQVNTQTEELSRLSEQLQTLMDRFTI